MTDAVAAPTAPIPSVGKPSPLLSLWACRFRSLAHFHGSR